MPTITLGHCACIINPETGARQSRCLAHAIQAAREALADAIADVDMTILTYHYARRTADRDVMHCLRARLVAAISETRNAQEYLDLIDVI